MAGSSQQIQLSSRTLMTDLKNLFDFEASGPDLCSECHAVPLRGVCMKAGDKVRCQGMMEAADPSAKPSFKFECKNEHITFTPAMSAKGPGKPWVVVNESQGGEAKLSVGDEILMGRALVTVCQLVTDPLSEETPKMCDGNGTLCKCLEPDLTEEVQCRICLSDGCTDDDPFVQPCLCSGSVANVHLGCLRQWTKTRLNLPHDMVKSFEYKTPICEMCKADYPANVSMGSSTVPLIESLPRVQAPFLVLRSSSSRSKDKGKPASFHAVSFAKNAEAKIGRGHEATVRLEEVSLSRWHSSIKFQDGEFVLQDHQSKYGTLLAMKTCAVGPQEALAVKVGRSVFSFSLSDVSGFPEPRSSRSSRTELAGGESLCGEKSSLARTETHDG